MLGIALTQPDTISWGFMPTPSSKLRGGVAYPRTRVEFDAFFPDDRACLDYLQKLRWPQGFVCPECGSTGSPWQMVRGLLLCSDCRKQTSVIAGTLFHRTRTPMRQWFMAAWEITCQKYGASALGLQRVLGLGSYKTAWAWLHKFRRAMVLPGRDPLGGIVEVDETYVGAEEADVVGRQTLTKAMVVVAVEVQRRKNRTRAVAVCAGPQRKDAHRDRPVLQSRTRGNACGASGHSSVEAMAPGHPPRRRIQRTPSLLPG